MKNNGDLQTRFYDQNLFTLVCRKSDSIDKNIGDGYYLIYNEEWKKEDDSLGLFRLFLTEIFDGQVKALKSKDGDFVLLNAIPYNRKKEFMEV